MSQEQIAACLERLNENISELRQNQQTENPLQKWAPTVVSVFTIITCFFTAYKYLETSYMKTIETQVIKYVSSESFKSTFENFLVNTIQEGEAKEAFVELVQKHLEKRNIEYNINFIQNIWKQYIYKEIDKQIGKIEKDPTDLKVADVRFLIDTWNSVGASSASYQIKIKKLEMFLINFH